MSVLLRTSNGIVSPKIVAPNVAPSHWTKAIGEIENQLTLEYTEKYYVGLAGISSNATIGKVWNHQRMAQQAVLGQITAPAFLIQANYEFDARQEALFDKSANGSVSFLNTNERLVRQAIAQKIRSGALMGNDAGEGIINGATNVAFGTDGQNQTLVTFDASWLANRLIQMARELITGVQNRVEVINVFSSLRTINYINTKLVPLQNSQKDGAGIDAIGGLIKRVLEDAFNTSETKLVVNVYPEPLLEKTDTAGKEDTILMVSPTLGDYKGMDSWERELNLVGEENSQKANTIIDLGGAGINVKTNPAINGVYSGYGYSVVTSGVTLRKEAVLKSSVKFDTP